MNYWLVVTSPANFTHDREILGFKVQGLPYRFRKQVQQMKPGDRVVYYIYGIQKIGATATITGEYYEEHTKMWTNDDEIWPSRCSSKPDFVLNDDELLDVKKLIEDMSFIERKDKFWGTYLQGSIRQIPEEDFKLIESEIKKIVSERSQLKKEDEKIEITAADPKTEGESEKAILSLPLQSSSLHDRLGEMLEHIGTWMDYNTQTRHKITPDHAYELDVAWLSGKNPEIAIEVQVSGNLTEAKDRLAQARKFNYRKVIMILSSSDLQRLNSLMRHEPELRSWMDAWSIGAVYKMYKSGEKFFRYYKQLRESVYKEKNQLELIV
jgi:predicted RNA-binding protein